MKKRKKIEMVINKNKNESHLLRSFDVNDNFGFEEELYYSIFYMKNLRALVFNSTKEQ